MLADVTDVTYIAYIPSHRLNIGWLHRHQEIK